ncbi:protein DMR6-LIKE OXYGENASE 2-like [Apium graveolens]|uniref:protein DMR6-LIKE OXYGENASE 2-like n=1 Tax=Apium graveolens TaxID=4045 RepID=UPI003D79ECB7
MRRGVTRHQLYEYDTFCEHQHNFNTDLKISNMGEVDPSFIQDIEHRPKLVVTEAQGIPLIDLSIPNTQLVVSQIAEACKNWGFFQVINHGVPLQLQEKVFLASKSFFSQSKEEKQRVRRDEFNPLGYYDTELTKNVRDWKEVFDFTVENPMVMPASADPQDKDVQKFVNQWPRNPKYLRELCEEYAKEVEKLSFKIMGLIALSLGLSPNRFDEFFKDSTSFIRLNYFPPCPIPDLALGVGRHKDAGALTVLYQDDVGGLEVKRKTDGEWIRVKPIPHAYNINVGDVIQAWSNDKYESVEHRVIVNSERERISIPFLFHPSHSTMVKPLVELTNDEIPANYKEYNWGKFFAARLLSNFKKLAVENIQINHYKVSA